MIKWSSIITNGYVAADTVEEMTKDGSKFVVTIPADLVHPHAMPTDKLSIFAKYIEPDCGGLERLTGQALESDISVTVHPAETSIECRATQALINLKNAAHRASVAMEEPNGSGKGV